MVIVNYREPSKFHEVYDPADSANDAGGFVYIKNGEVTVGMVQSGLIRSVLIQNELVVEQPQEA